MTDGPLRIAVCMKAVLDPEAPPSMLRLDPDGVTVSGSGTPPVLNPYDTNAVAAALELREHHGGEVVVVSVDPKPPERVFRKALAAGADSVTVMRTAPDPAGTADSWATAAVLAGLVTDLGGFDLLLAGRQAADTSAGLVGTLLAGILDLPLVTSVTDLEVTGAEMRATRLVDGGTEAVTAALPAVATVSSEIGELAYPSLPALRAAQTKPYNVLDPPPDTGAATRGGRVEVTAVTRPETTTNCEILPDGTALAAALIDRGLLG